MLHNLNVFTFKAEDNQIEEESFWNVFVSPL